jgi:protein tyrosine phosphatase
MDEFMSLHKLEYEDTNTEGSNDENIILNRYSNVLPWDSSRVKIETLPISYINASYFRVF